MRTLLASVCGAVAAGALGLFGLCSPIQPAHAGTIILEGSDAIGFHCTGGNASACQYRDQAWSAIGGASLKPIAVIGDVPGIGSNTHPVDDFSSVAAAGSLSQYVALYFVAGGGCCAENDSLITAAGAQAAVTGYLAAGGTVMIENYIGGAAWDFAIGAGGNGNAHVAGVAGGFPSSLSCSDGETVTADGTANGFTQPGVMGCWTHQGYDPAFFGPLGFNESFFDSPTGLGIDGWSSLLSSGHTVSFGTPEPMSLALFGSALVFGAVARRRRSSKT